MIRNKIMPEMTPKSNKPHSDQDDPGAQPPTAPDAGRGTPRVLESSELLGAQGEVLIRHEGRMYRLRRTRLGKLILTA
jgi:hemin uptake protein HemP